MTLVAVLLLQNFIVIFAGVTGGEIGMTVPDVLSIDAPTNYEYALGFMVVCAMILFGLSRSAMGLILQASGQDATEAAALGFNVTKHKTGGILRQRAVLRPRRRHAGVLSRHRLGRHCRRHLDRRADHHRRRAGRAAHHPRARVIGAVFLILAGELLRPLGQLNTLVVAAVALAVILFFPDGFLGYCARAGRSRA